MAGTLEVFRQKADEETRSVKKQADDIRKLCDAFGDQIAQGKIRLTKNDKVIESQKKRLDDAITEYQKQFSADQNTRGVAFLKAIEDTGAKYKVEFQKEKSGWDALLQEAKVKSDADIKYIVEIKKKVDELYGAIGSVAFAGNFSVASRGEAKAANYWRLVAFGLMVIMGASA